MNRLVDPWAFTKSEMGLWITPIVGVRRSRREKGREGQPSDRAERVLRSCEPMHGLRSFPYFMMVKRPPMDASVAWTRKK